MALKSGLERSLDIQLKQSGITYSYETLQLAYTLEGVYSPDFILSNGIIIEAKGYLDPAAKRKMEAISRQHGDLDIRFIFSDSSKRFKGSKQNYGTWATKYGFKFADGRIPAEWLTEGSISE